MVIYGWVINKKSTNLFMQMDFSVLELNIFNSDMIELENSFIFKTEGFIFRYNIDKHGLVPFWNPLSKKIEKRFKELKNERKNNKR